MRVAAAPAIEKRIFVVRERQLMLDDYCELAARGTATTGRPEADEVLAGSGTDMDARLSSGNGHGPGGAGFDVGPRGDEDGRFVATRGQADMRGLATQDRVSS